MRDDPREIPKVNILGVSISAINIDFALDMINHWILARAKRYVCVCTVHTIMECRRSPSLRQLVNAAGINTPDGMPLVWLARRKHPWVSRVYGPDLLLAELERSLVTGHRHFLYGGVGDVAQKLSSALLRRFPGVQIVGAMGPAVAPVEALCTPETVAKINSATPDIVWVGISTPKQERWMAQMRLLLDAPVLIGVGAAFDFHSGMVKQAPGWVQNAGLEWLFRLIQEPRRLWKRYLYDNPRFIVEVALQHTGLRRYKL